MINCTIKGIKWTIENFSENTLYYYYLGHHGLSDRITVLDRLTGFGDYIRDVETGYRDINGNFWLASGHFDIRDYPELTIEQAIEKIKSNANTCRGDL